ncbi:NAD(P)/FAD-dependent oxidoreductase [Enemella sp. A6]|uniref:NAD(P)/FAD-dependent oxidoreductase n=1 Tax=Enemella sp. A6 TaxID=3440152 RepID=UPI003EB9D83C
MKHIVIAGASLAGLSAAEALREAGFEGDLTMLSAEDVVPYDRPPLSKEALQTGVDLDRLALRPTDWYDDNGVQLRLSTTAGGLDAVARQLRLDGGEVIDFDGLVIATGSHARRLTAFGEDRGFFYLRTHADAVRLREHLVPGGHLVVIGAGFIGLEIAASARVIGLDVTVLEVAPSPLSRAFGDQVGEWIRQVHERNGITFRCGCRVETVDQSDGKTLLRLGTDEMIEADVVVAGVGAAPNVEWLAGSGLKVTDGVVCQPGLTTGAPGIVAAGDVARWYNPTFDEVMRIEHWTNAVEQGRHAAWSLMDPGAPFMAVPYFWSDQHEAKIRFVGRANAADTVRIERSTDEQLVALYGRDGVITGAVCANAPRELARLRKAISDRAPLLDVIGTSTSPR